MNEGKEPMGYHTPNKEIQDAFATTKNEISQNITNWEWLNQRANEIFAKKTKKEVDHRGLFTFSLINLIGISRLGIELAETHKRLTSVEKSLKELHLKLK